MSVPRANGFTLIELLVSLVLLGLVGGMLGAGTLLTRRMTERVELQSATNQTIVTAQTIVRDRIEALVPSARFDLDKPTVDIVGEPSKLSFLAPALPAARPTTVGRYRLLRTATGQIVLYESPDLSTRIDPRAGGEVGWTPTILLTGVRFLTIDYFGARKGDGERRWHHDWTAQPLPPELVRVRLDFARGDRRQWPDLIMRPAATINSACRLDPFSGKCAGT